MKPLLSIVVTILVIVNAHPDNIEAVKQLPQTQEPIVEAEESEPLARIERCTTCSGPKLNLKSHKDVLAALTQFPGAEVHTQQSFEGCSSDKGCAGIKVKDGQVLERFGNVDAFQAAAARDTGNEFSFHAAGTFGNNLLEGANDGNPFWWMNNDQLKNGGGSFEKFSKSSSSFSTTGNAGDANFNIAANPFLNGDFSKLAGGFNAGASLSGVETKPSTFQSSSFESSSFSTSNKDLDLSNNPFLNGKAQAGLNGFQAQGAFGANEFGNSQFAQNSASQSGQSSQFGASGQGQFGASGQNGQQFGASANKFSATASGNGYAGSSPSPFTATTGANVNLIQNSQKSEFDFEQSQQTQQNIDDAFRNTGNVQAHDGSHSGGALQQTCAGQGYVCVHKAQCNNGVVNQNGRNPLQANTQKQYCNTKTEICCRIELSNLGGAGNQGSLGVGSGLFATQSGSNQAGFSASGQGQSSFNQNGQSGQGFQGQGSLNSFGQSSQGSGFSQSGFSQSGQASQGSQSFNGQGSQGSQGFNGQGSQGFNGQGSQGSQGFNGQGSQGTNQNSAFGSSFNKATSSSFGTQGSFGAGSNLAGNSGSNGFGSNSNNANGFESSSSSFEASNKKFGFGSAPTTNRYNNNEVYKSTSQSNFIETDSFSAGSENVYRPGAVGLKPGIPYLPPVDSSTSSSNQVSSTAFVTTQRPFTTPRPVPTKPVFVPSTAAPGYLPPQGESSNNRETRLPSPKPTYSEGELILDESRQPTRRPSVYTPGPTPSDIPAGCAAALKCTPIEFCTAEGVISTTAVVLTKDQDAYRVPLTDCRDIESGRVGKCCRDPLYTDPWPTNQLGKWVPGVFGGNDGQYVPDSRGSSSNNNPRPGVTVRPPVTGSVILNNFIQPKPTSPTFGPNQVTAGFPSSTPSYSSTKGQGQYSTASQGQFSTGGQGQYSTGGQGQYSTGGQGQYTTGGQGQYGTAGKGQSTQGAQFGQGSQFTQTTSTYGQSTKGQGQISNQGQGIGVTLGLGTGVIQGQGTGVSQGQGSYAQTGQSQFTQTQGIRQGQVQSGSQGQGQNVIQGQGQSVNQAGGQFGVQGVGQISTQGQGIKGSGSRVTGSQGFVSQSQGQSQLTNQGQGQLTYQGQGQLTNQGQGQGVITGQGQSVSTGFGIGVSQGSGFNTVKGQGQGIRQGQVVSQGQGSSVSQGQGQYQLTGQGQKVSQGAGFGISQGSGFGVNQGAGFGITAGIGGASQGFKGQGVSQGQGSFVTEGQRQTVTQGSGGIGSQGVGLGVTFGQGGIGFGLTEGGQSGGQGGIGINQGGGVRQEGGFGFGLNQGFGVGFNQGQGQKLTQGIGSGEINGQGFKVIQGGGVGLENEYSESIQRVFLQQYSAGGQCGLLNPQKPFGNRDDLEADFGEIPWQAMVLLQTNRSLLCGGVITRPDVVLTSAACVEGLDAKNVLIKGGEWKLGIDDEPLPFQIVQVKNILRHPFYSRGSLKYDAAILVLAENLRFAKNIYPICLPGSKDTLDGFYNGAGECIVTGWGKTVLQAHLKGSIMHSVNVSLLNPGECQAKLSQDYPHLVEQYDAESCACGQPTNPVNNICKVDIGSALACTTGDGHYVMRGIYSWDSGCQIGNQIAGFYKFDLEWYEWAIGLIESIRFAKYTTGTKITNNAYTSQINSGIKTSQIKGISGISGIKASDNKDQFGLGQLGQFAQFGSSKYTEGSNAGLNFGTEIKPLTNTFSATYTEKKIFQSEPKIVTYTTKPEIVTFTTKPEYFTYTTKPKLITYTTKPEIVTYTTKPEIVTYTTKPKIISYTTKPQIIRYETSGSGTNPQYVAPGVSFNPSLSDALGHKHTGQCKCLEGK